MIERSYLLKKPVVEICRFFYDLLVLKAYHISSNKRRASIKRRTIGTQIRISAAPQITATKLKYI